MLVMETKINISNSSVSPHCCSASFKNKLRNAISIGIFQEHKNSSNAVYNKKHVFQKKYNKRKHLAIIISLIMNLFTLSVKKTEENE